jgi:hypothetical protein
MNRNFFIFTICVFLGCMPAYAEQQNIKICDAIKNGSGLEPDESYMKALSDSENGWLIPDSHLQPVKPMSADVAADVARLSSILNKNGTQLAMVWVPYRSIVYPDKVSIKTRAGSRFDKEAAISGYVQLVQQWQKLGVLTPNLYEVYRGTDESNPVFFKRDPHWTPRGAELAASAVADLLRSRPTFKKIPSRNYETKTVATKSRSGQYVDILNRACGLSIAPELVEVRQTTAKEQEDTGNLLEEDKPSIVLLGTSMSTNAGNFAFNFAGALQQALSADIENNSVGGGKADGAILDYFSSGRYVEDRPSFIIWETPVYYPLNSNIALRQIIPAIQHTCNADNAMAYNKVDLLGGEQKILTVPLSIKSQAKRDYIYLQISDLSVVQFGLQFQYADGKKENLQIKRSTRTRNNGRFFMEIAMNNLLEVTISPNNNGSGSIEGHLCAGQ